jgi:hypothetical protein
MSDGGFVYRLNQPFIHMGIKRTASGPNKSNLFSTWFRVHTLALISEILTGEYITQLNWQFNNSCSMGWHKKWDKNLNQLTLFNKIQEIPFILKNIIFKNLIYRTIKRLVKNIKYSFKDSQFIKLFIGGK